MFLESFDHPHNYRKALHVNYNPHHDAIFSELYKECQNTEAESFSRQLKQNLRHITRLERKEIVSQSRNGYSPLHLAFLSGKVKKVQYLIDFCDVNVENSGVLKCLEEPPVHSIAPLRCATVFDKQEIINFLVKRGANRDSIVKKESNLRRSAYFLNHADLVSNLGSVFSNMSRPNFISGTCIISVLHLSILIFVLSSFFVHSDAFERPCRSIDIRTSIDEFKKLENCTVIEGNLQMVLIKEAPPDSYKNLSFPLLTEVTDYILFFRVFGLTSLGKLFPNLSVIRGQMLYHNYALVIFEMKDLQEVGLVNLTSIVKGAVRIERNSNLCFAETVNWDLITKAGRGLNHVKDNKPLKECPKCSKSENVNCPVVNSMNGLSTVNGLCWNEKHCQRICSSDCESRNLTCNINDPSQCCDQQCIGGCTGKTAEDCIVCREFVIPKDGRKSCKKRCVKPNEYEFLGRRCISYQDCLALATPTENGVGKIFTFETNKVSQCLSECPTGYQPSTTNYHECVRCDGICMKECKGNETISSAGSAQKLRGCTVIDGYLEISIQGGGRNIIEELEESLQHIQTIKGYLKISRSYPLITLYFFKSLQTIEGEVLDRSNYSLVVLDNQNLQELFPVDPVTLHSKVNVTRGKLFFHLNPKLCVSKIKRITRAVGGENEQDISLISNGEKTSCNVINLKLRIKGVSSSGAYITWPDFMDFLTDYRTLLGYLVYYREAQSGNVSMYAGRDACNSNGWVVKEIQVHDKNRNETNVEYLLLDLKPYTRYALYVETYTIKSGTFDDKAGQSDIIYFDTKPSTPSQPMNLAATSLSPDEILLHWAPPKKPNGIISFYRVKVIQEPTIAFTDRDYCVDPPNYEASAIPDEKINKSRWLHNNITDEKDSNKSKDLDEKDCCPCQAPSTAFDPEDEVKTKVSFEDYLLNHVYVKNDKPEVKNHEKRTINDKKDSMTVKYLRKRSLIDNNHIQSLDFYSRNVSHQNSTSSVDEPFEIVREVEGTSLSIRNLSHYTRYSVEVRACHSSQTPEAEQDCSIQAITSILTVKRKDADEINPDSISFTLVNATRRTSLIKVKWDEPKSPNGIILAYYIEFKAYEGPQRDSTHRCVPRKEYLQNQGIKLYNLSPGTYLLRVRALSSAGKGNFTQYVQFSVPNTAIFLYILFFFMAGALILVVGFLMAYVFFKKKFSRAGNMIYSSMNPEYISHQPDEWELKRDKIKLISELGQGSFGMVHLGEMKGKDPDDLPIKCAVKTVTDSSMTKQFIKEADTMKTFDCHHVVKLLGVVLTSQPLWVVMELMPNGDLRNYLIRQRPDNDENSPGNPPTIKEIWRMSAEIADGMAYLGSRKFVHRDLAARNIMVDYDLTLKIGDFGMTRDIYETDYYRKDGQGLLPVRWMAPESLRDGIYTYCTDVWSYGIVLYEMATLGAQPYQGLANVAVMNFIINGNTIEKPENCPAKLYYLMTQCWELNPKGRPTFLEIIDSLMSELDSEKFLKVSYYAKAKSKILTKTQPVKEVTCRTPLKSEETICKFEEEVCDNETADTHEGDASCEVKFFPTTLDVLNRSTTLDIESTSNDNSPSPEKVGTLSSSSEIKNRANNLKKDENGKSTPTPGTIPTVNSADSSKERVSNGNLVNGSLVQYSTTMC